MLSLEYYCVSITSRYSISRRVRISGSLIVLIHKSIKLNKRRMFLTPSSPLVHKPNIYNSQKHPPKQARLKQITRDGVHILEDPTAPDQRPEQYGTQHQPNPYSPCPEHNRVPSQAERKLAQVQEQRSGLVVESAVHPNKPSRETGKKRRDQPSGV